MRNIVLYITIIETIQFKGFFQDVQKILLPHFDIPHGFGLGKIP